MISKAYLSLSLILQTRQQLKDVYGVIYRYLYNNIFLYLYESLPIEQLVGTFTAVKYLEKAEEPECHNVTGNGKRDGAKAQRSFWMLIGGSKMVNNLLSRLLTPKLAK